MERQRLMSRVGLVLAGAAAALALSGAPVRAVTFNIARAEVIQAHKDGVLSPECSFVAQDGIFRFICDCDAIRPQCGNISNEPHIEFEQIPRPNGTAGAQAVCTLDTTAGVDDVGALPGTFDRNFCNDSVFLCAAVGYQNETAVAVALDELQFELFKFQDGSNPLDPGSTPPLRTFYIDSVGTAGAGSGVLPNTTGGAFCVLWDGSTNIQGEFGKTNGQYGFRVTAKTQIQSGDSGNITITAIRAYPGSTTRDTGDNPVPQKPIIVDVTNVHLVRSSATVVGQTGVVVQPYNFSYRLSKDAEMYININSTFTPFSVVRSLVPGLPRVGEGVPNGTLINGDTWNGRFNNGDLGPPRLYLATLQAFSRDQFGSDMSVATTRQVALDPLQVTDVRVQPLLAGSTSLAVLTYELTESATAFVEIYPPNVQFCPVGAVTNPLNDVNNPTLDNAASTNNSEVPPKNFGPKMDNCAAGTVVTPLRRFVEQKEGRRSVTTFWDGRDRFGNMQPDGNYTFVVYAALPSQNGFQFGGSGGSDRRIWSTQARAGNVPIDRGNIGISQISPASSVVGSSPAVAGLDPFSFRYTLSRDAIVTMRIYKSVNVNEVNQSSVATANLVKTLVDGELRPGLFTNTERWEVALTSGGATPSSGTYIIQLQAADPLLPSKVSTATALFPVNLFRITDAAATPLLGGATEFSNIFYQLSQTMNVGINIYPPGTVIDSFGSWPPCNSLTPGTCSQTTSGTGQPIAPILTIKGMKPGRRTLIESWDGRDNNGLFVTDGQYLFTIAAESTTTPKYFATDRIIGSINVVRGAIVFTSFAVRPDVPRLFNSSNTITLHPFTIEYGLNRQSSVTVQILTTSVPPTIVRNIVAGAVRESGALLQEVWDGRDDRGNFPRSGFYNVRATAQDIASILASGSTAQLTISYDPIRIFDLAITPLQNENAGVIAYQVSETMKVALKIYRPGTVFDASGNPSPPEIQSLVKRFVGIRPARTLIEELWDGTDLRNAAVPDGIYKFRIIASTDIASIDSITGDALPGASLSLDRPIDDIPVVRAAQSIVPERDFEVNTFFYPNPVHGDSANIKIFVPIQAKVTMKIFNIAGQLVYDQDFGEWPSNSCVQDVNCTTGFVWNKVNNFGRKIARGLYYAVIREEETLGGRQVLQTTKKILIP